MFSFGRVGHYASKGPYRENDDNEGKGKDVDKKNGKNIFSTEECFYCNEDSQSTFDDGEDTYFDSNTSYKILRDLENQLTSELDSYKEDYLINRFRNVNKELETKERSILKEINL